MPKTNYVENCKFVDDSDKENHSCQRMMDKDKGWIQKGNKIAATIGVQMLLNYTRGYKNKTISLGV
jgi:hypothetical protein